MVEQRWLSITHHRWQKIQSRIPELAILSFASFLLIKDPKQWDTTAHVLLPLTIWKHYYRHSLTRELAIFFWHFSEQSNLATLVIHHTWYCRWFYKKEGHHQLRIPGLGFQTYEPKMVLISI